MRLLSGQPLYDMSFTETGGFGLFYYPPTFAPLVLPFGLLSATATWVWTAPARWSSSRSASSSCRCRAPSAGGSSCSPGLSWPFVYAVKLGQVGPILFLLFAIGWRWLDDPIRLGVSGALGAAIKIQPGLILVWAMLTRRWRAVVVGAVTLLGAGGRRDGPRRVRRLVRLR